MRKFRLFSWLGSGRRIYNCSSDDLIHEQEAVSEIPVPTSSNRSYQSCDAERYNEQGCIGDAVQGQPTAEIAGRWKQYFATLAVSLAAFAVGSGSGWASPMLILFKSDSSPVGKMTLTEMSYLETLPTFGSLLGIFLYGGVIDKLGRKAAGHFVWPLSIVGWAILIVATNPFHLYVGRFLLGISGCGGMLVGAVYLSEVVHESRRGSMMGYLMFVTNLGSLLGFILGDALPYRWFNVTCIIAPILFPILFFSLPESPYYLVSKSKPDSAKDSLLYFRGGDEQIVHRELQSILNYQKPNVSLRLVFRSKATRKALLILIFMFSFQQLGGATVIQGYASTIFADGGNDVSPNTSATALSILKVVSTYASLLFIDRVGRRIMMMSTFAVMSICLAILSAYFYVKEHSSFRADVIVEYSWIPLASLCGYNVAVSFGVGTLGEVIGNEVIPTEIKGLASMVSGSITISTMMLCLQAYPFVHDYVGIYANFAYEAVLNLLACVITFIVIPETKGKTLEQIKAYLGS